MAHFLDVAELRGIERLRLAPRRTFVGATRGERLTTRRGISIEFSDYRSYAEGDDLRHVDWNILARLGQAVTKTYRDEEDLSVHLLLDCSASMNFGEPTKFECAARLAWALGYVTLSGGDALYPRVLGSHSAPPPPMRGRQSAARFTSWLNAAEPGQSAPLSESIERFVRSSARKGIALLISDGMDEQLPSALATVGARGHDLMFLQVVSDIELDPDIEGDLKLIDAESGRSVELTANSYVLAEYKRRLAAHQSAIESAVQRSNGRHLLVTTGQSFDDVVTQGLKRYGWVKA